MSYRDVPVEQFAGLNLTDDPGEVGWNGAIDLQDVDLTMPGRVRSRPGYTQLATTGHTPSTVFYSRATSSYLTAESDDRLYRYDANGVVLTSYANFDHTACDFLDYGPAAYGITIGVGGIVSYSGGAFTNVSAVTGQSFTVEPWDERLVVASGNGYRVKFSNPNDFTTFGANNYVDFPQGNGGPVNAVRTWGNQVFVLKADMLFVFYGTTDTGGNPVFNYRRVDTEGIGCVTYNAAVAGKEGVYFVHDTGVYLTTGGIPQKISGAIDPIFNGESSFFTGDVLSTTTGIRVRYYNGRLLIAYNTGSTPRTLVYHPPTGTWSYYTWGAVDYALRGATGSQSVSFINSTAFNVHSLVPGVATDNGVAVSSRYRSGFSDLGTPDIKTVREWVLEGWGTPTFKTSHDFGSLSTGSSVTLGTSPAVAENRYRTAERGRQFSFQVSGTGAWSLNNVVAHVREKRAPGVHANA